MGSDGLFGWLGWLRRFAESQTGGDPSAEADEVVATPGPLPVGEVPPLPRWQHLDLDDFSRVYALNFDHLFRYFLGVTRDAELAQDLTQEVFGYALRHADRFPLRRQTERAWLFYIARRRVLPRHWRRSRRRCETEFLRRQEADVEPADATVGLVRAELRARVRQLIDRFEPDRRDVFLLTVYLEYPVPDTAETLGMKEGTVRSHLRRGRLQLARWLRDDPGLTPDERRALTEMERDEAGQIVTPEFRPQAPPEAEDGSGEAADPDDDGPQDRDDDDDTLA